MATRKKKKDSAEKSSAKKKVPSRAQRVPEEGLSRDAYDHSQRQEPGTGTSPEGNERRTRRWEDYSARRAPMSRRERLEAAQEALEEKDAVVVVAMRVGYYNHKRRRIGEKFTYFLGEDEELPTWVREEDEDEAEAEARIAEQERERAEALGRRSAAVETAADAVVAAAARAAEEEKI